jgi:hypothetical protein
MGGLFGIGGSSSKTDRKEQLTSFQDLHNVFNFALPAGEQAFKTGQSMVGDAASYWKNILTGNRASVSAAVAPETNAVRAGADASKRQLATSGTARGGGVNAASRTLDDSTRAKTDNAIFGARPEAAKQTAAIGSTELSAALNALGLGETSANDLGKIATDSKKQSDANGAAMGQAAGQIAMAALMFA